ncbi:uncharacterized protein F5Z01DRAFT_638375 [Emericellopsis atlantica]|uniref:Uncharacterized protein n=1 Tax=Emericellopsis atlantica TaxID=2614577 RepID=A0A9P7ZI61_9HYPO|nr:uncharacterized protein F5Z01DRAFT_638375 [Emericellopsis atlantica]KAG9252504.1 hypothetical protein F5Z01DRAFT_638375 [Emericellopsis atlantica]
MVSFFGLRFGGDKKKLQDKQKEAEKSAKKWKKGQKESFGSDQSFGNDICAPQRPPSRPGTGHSIRSTMLFRAPFANAQATSSMVDLAPPSVRRPSAASLRQASSSSNLKGKRPVISGPIGPPVSLPLDGHFSVPGTPTRPGTANSMKKDWVNPLDVHFGKGDRDAPQRPHTSAGPTAKRPPRHSDFDIGSQGDEKSRVMASVGPNGYPSPPPSIKSEDPDPLIRVSTEPKSTKPTALSALRRVNTAEPNLQLATNEGGLESPVVRNALAKRDTMSFHSPRRRSISKQTNDSASARRVIKNRTDEEKAEIKKRRQTEGFEGNFSAFNFGAPAVDTSIPLPTERPISPTNTSDRTESPIDRQRLSSPFSDRQADRPVDRKNARERGMSEAMTIEAAVDQDDGLSMTESSDSLFPQPPAHEAKRSDNTLSLTPSIESLTKPARPRGDSDTRGPNTPTALRAPPPISARPSICSVHSSDSARLVKEAPPPKLNPDRRSQSPLRSKAAMEGDFPFHQGLPRGRKPGSIGSIASPTSELFDHAPPPTLHANGRSQSPLRARQPAEGDFPVNKGLPRGRRPGPGSPAIAPVPASTTAAPPRPPREDEGLTVTPAWAERAEKHLSALPAPLTPAVSRASHLDSDISPWASKEGGAPFLAAPRLPSPTFSSLEESLSENLAKTFDDYPSEDHVAKPLISPTLSEFGPFTGRGHKGSSKASPYHAASLQREHTQREREVSYRGGIL